MLATIAFAASHPPVGELSAFNSYQSCAILHKYMKAEGWQMRCRCGIGCHTGTRCRNGYCSGQWVHCLAIYLREDHWLHRWLSVFGVLRPHLLWLLLKCFPIESPSPFETTLCKELSWIHMFMKRKCTAGPINPNLALNMLLVERL